MKKALTFGLLVAATLSQAQLYSRAVETGSRYNPAVAGTASSTIITFDDVNVSNTLNPSQLALNITRVTYGLRRAADAPAVTVSGYWATGSFTGPTLGASNLIGSQTLAARAGTGFITELVSFNTNFVVAPNFAAQPGFGQFFVGLNIADNITSPAGTATPTGWRITSGAGLSEDRFLQRDSVAGAVTGPYWFGGIPANPPGSFYIVMEGSPVPEPASMVALGLGLAGIVARKRRKN